MNTRTMIAVMVLAFSTTAIAEDEKAEKSQEDNTVLAYCEQLGQTAGFESEDLSSFIQECVENRSGEKKEKSEES